MEMIYNEDNRSKMRARLKKEIIRNNIYGVDIEEGAIEIARLRFWLSIVIDLDKPEALPNFDYKFMQGNSLIEGYQIENAGGNGKKKKSVYIDLSDICEEKKDENGVIQFEEGGKEREDLMALLHDYYKESDHEKKKELRGEIEKQVRVLLNAKLFQTQSNAINNMSVICDKFFLWHLWFKDVFDKGGFDIVIGNPPYIDSETMVKVMPLLRNRYSLEYKFAVGNWDIFVLFVELGLRITTKEGIYAFILPNKLIAAKYANSLRKALTTESRILELRDYGSVPVFTNASVYPATLIGIKGNNTIANSHFSVMNSITSKSIDNVIDNQTFANIQYWDACFFMPNEVSIFNKIIRHNILCNTSGIEIFGAATVGEAYQLKDILQDEQTSKNVLKVVNTGTIDRYTNWWRIVSMQYIKEKYKHPIVKKDLLKTLSAKRLQQAYSNKIIVAGMSKSIEAIYDEGQILAGKSTTIILGKTSYLKFILGIINSKLIYFFIPIAYNSLKMAGGFINIGVREIEQLPIPAASSKQQQEIIDIVDKILSAKKINPATDTTSDERQIDALVYELYGITTYPELLEIEGDKGKALDMERLISSHIKNSTKINENH